jgi:hypothetical protein
VVAKANSEVFARGRARRKKLVNMYFPCLIILHRYQGQYSGCFFFHESFSSSISVFLGFFAWAFKICHKLIESPSMCFILLRSSRMKWEKMRIGNFYRCKVVCNLKLSHYQESFSDGITKNLSLNVFCHIYGSFECSIIQGFTAIGVVNRYFSSVIIGKIS